MALQLTGNRSFGSPVLSLSQGTSTRFCWGPFGETAPRTGPAASLPGFNGERADPLSGVTHLGNGYRAYSPTLRRFTCPDSQSPFGIGGINPYVYCNGDPINATDPSGHGPISFLLRVAIKIARLAGMADAVRDSLVSVAAGIEKVEVGVALAGVAATGIASGVEKAKGNTAQAQALGWTVLGQVAGFAINVALETALGGIFKRSKKAAIGLRSSVRERPEISDPFDARKTASVFGYDRELINLRDIDGNVTQVPGIQASTARFWMSDFDGEGSDLIFAHGDLTPDGTPVLGIYSSGPLSGGESEPIFGSEAIIDHFKSIDIDLTANKKPLHIVACQVGGHTSGKVITLGDALADQLGRTIYTYGCPCRNVSTIEAYTRTYPFPESKNKILFPVDMPVIVQGQRHYYPAPRHMHTPEGARSRIYALGTRL